MFFWGPPPTVTSNLSPELKDKLDRIRKYISFHQSNKTEYIISRIKKLSEGRFLESYEWNYTDSPSDSQIIMNCFLAFMDEQTRSQVSFSETEFSSFYFVKEQKCQSDQAIYQVSTIPSHYNVIVKTDRIETYTIEKGINNVFIVLIIFLYLVKKNGGHILHRKYDLGSQFNNLNQIVKDF